MPAPPPLSEPAMVKAMGGVNAIATAGIPIPNKGLYLPHYTLWWPGMAVQFLAGFCHHGDTKPHLNPIY
ncbi:MAG: hypothetical protein OHK0012_02420 [Synechococcales cyanobacterium]